MAISAPLQALIAGESVAGSRLGRKLADELLAEGLLAITTHGSRRSYRARAPQALKQYLVDKEERYRSIDVPTTDTRAAMAEATGNSKLTNIRSCPGFPVNSYEPIACRLGNDPFLVNPQEGCFLFVTDWQRFAIPHDVTVVGVENMENFRMVRRQRAFIESYLMAHDLPPRALFVSRYPQSSDLRRWLMAVSNPYLHFGDFDLAGIHIFLSEFQRYLGVARASFLIPTDIAARLHAGSSQRYDEQYAHFQHLTAPTPDLQRLIDLIHRERKGYDQEGYVL